jgi:Ca2+/Na+ antiporter
MKVGDEGEICIGVLAIAAILVIIYHIILFILTYLIQILIIVTIALVVYYVYSKQKEITKWIQPSIVSQTESETSRDVRKNRGEPISPATKTEISILRDKISNETSNKDRLKNQHSNLKNLMKKKRDELDKLKNDVHGIIIGSKNGYKGKYKEEEDAWEKGKSDAAKAAASYIDARKHILELRDDIRKIGSTREKTTEKSPKETYYDILDIDCKANQDKVKKAYRDKIREYHPDRQHPDSREWVKEESDKRSKKINEAYEVLFDPEKRKQYNRENGLC